MTMSLKLPATCTLKRNSMVMLAPGASGALELTEGTIRLEFKPPPERIAVGNSGVVQRTITLPFAVFIIENYLNLSRRLT